MNKQQTSYPLLKGVLHRNLLFLLWNAAFAVFFFPQLRELMQTCWKSPYFSYVPLVPIITAYLLFMNRKKIFSCPPSSRQAAILLAGAAAVFFIAADQAHILFNRSNYQSLMALSLVVLWISGFTVLYGVDSLREAAFPVLFLFLAVPLPDSLLEHCILFLRQWSSAAVHVFFIAAGTPFGREGFVFHLPTLDIEVAKECSGVRAGLSLVITALFAGSFFLRSGWSRAVLVIAAVPITIVKNGLRIFVLSILGVYVDSRMLTESTLHSRMGILFFMLSLFIVGGLIVLLRKFEKRSGQDQRLDGWFRRK